MAATSAVIVLVSLLLLSCSCHAEDNHAILLQVIDAVEKLIGFYKSSYQNLNLDGVYGLRVVEGQIESLLDEVRQGKHTHLKPDIVMRLHTMKEDLQWSTERAVPAVQANDEQYFKQLGFIVAKPWKMFKWHRKVVPVLRWEIPLYKSNTNNEISEVQSDKCMAELRQSNRTEAEGDSGQRCQLSEHCGSVMTKKGLTGYSITHQLIWTMLAEMVGCEADMSALLRKLGFSSMGHMQEEFCTNVYYEMLAVVHVYMSGTVKSHYQDIFLEQQFVCPSLGFYEFLKKKYLDQILSWQFPSGCFGARPEGGKPLPQDPKPAQRPHNADSSHRVSSLLNVKNLDQRQQQLSQQLKDLQSNKEANKLLLHHQYSQSNQNNLQPQIMDTKQRTVRNHGNILFQKERSDALGNQGNVHQPSLNTNNRINGQPPLNMDNRINRQPPLNTNNRINGQPPLSSNSRINGQPEPPLNTNSRINGQPPLNMNNRINGQPPLNSNSRINGQPQLNTNSRINGQPPLNMNNRINGQPPLNTNSRINGQPELPLNTNSRINGQPPLNMNNRINGQPPLNMSNRINGQPPLNMSNRINGLLVNQNKLPAYARQSFAGEKLQDSASVVSKESPNQNSILVSPHVFNRPQSNILNSKENPLLKPQVGLQLAQQNSNNVRDAASVVRKQRGFGDSLLPLNPNPGIPQRRQLRSHSQPDSYYDAGERNGRKLLEERHMPGDCLSHKTSVAAGALAMYLRYLVDPGPLDLLSPHDFFPEASRSLLGSHKANTAVQSFLSDQRRDFAANNLGKVEGGDNNQDVGFEDGKDRREVNVDDDEEEEEEDDEDEDGEYDDKEELYPDAGEEAGQHQEKKVVHFGGNDHPPHTDQDDEYLDNKEDDKDDYSDENEEEEEEGDYIKRVKGDENGAADPDEKDNIDEDTEYTYYDDEDDSDRGIIKRHKPQVPPQKGARIRAHNRHKPHPASIDKVPMGLPDSPPTKMVVVLLSATSLLLIVFMYRFIRKRHIHVRHNSRGFFKL